MLNILNFEPYFAKTLPETCALIMSGNLTLHPAVAQVILHGSRGLAGGYSSTSDLDLSLIVDAPLTSDMGHLCHEVLEETLDHWQSEAELDLAVIFDTRNCKLACFEQTTWNEHFCQVGGIDCFGLYKTQKGFSGLVTNDRIEVKRMYPCLKIWQRRTFGNLT